MLEQGRAWFKPGAFPFSLCSLHLERVSSGKHPGSREASRAKPRRDIPGWMDDGGVDYGCVDGRVNKQENCSPYLPLEGLSSLTAGPHLYAAHLEPLYRNEFVLLMSLPPGS